MNDRDLQKIRGVVQDVVEEVVVGVVQRELEPIKKTLNEHTQKIDALTSEVFDIHQEVGAIWTRVSSDSDENTKQITEIKQHIGLSTASQS